MRSQSKPTWGWSDILAATGYTDAALRRQIQRQQVEIEAPTVNGRTRADIWDIARLRVARNFCHLGAEPKEAFGLAKFIVGRAYKDLIEGRRKFSKASAKTQRIMFAVNVTKSGDDQALPQIISVDASDPEDRARAFKQLVFQATVVQRGLLPLHWFVLDSWSKLPNRPENMREWMDISLKQMQGIFA